MKKLLLFLIPFLYSLAGFSQQPGDGIGKLFPKTSTAFTSNQKMNWAFSHNLAANYDYKSPYVAGNRVFYDRHDWQATDSVAACADTTICTGNFPGVGSLFWECLNCISDVPGGGGLDLSPYVRKDSLAILISRNWEDTPLTVLTLRPDLSAPGGFFVRLEIDTVAADARWGGGGGGGGHVLKRNGTTLAQRATLQVLSDVTDDLRDSVATSASILDLRKYVPVTGSSILNGVFGFSNGSRMDASATSGGILNIGTVNASTTNLGTKSLSTVNLGGAGGHIAVGNTAAMTFSSSLPNSSLITLGYIALASDINGMRIENGTTGKTVDLFPSGITLGSPTQVNVLNEAGLSHTVGSFSSSLAFTTPTANRTITFQNGSGTVAFLSDITGGTSSPLTTKGDLYTYNTTNARLPVGPDGYALVANSASSTGLLWKNLSSILLDYVPSVNDTVDFDFSSSVPRSVVSRLLKASGGLVVPEGAKLSFEGNSVANESAAYFQWSGPRLVFTGNLTMSGNDGQYLNNPFTGNYIYNSSTGLEIAADGVQGTIGQVLTTIDHPVGESGVRVGWRAGGGAPTGAAGGDLTGSTYPNPTIASNAVTNAKAAQMATNTLKGNNTGSTANPADLTVAQAKTLLAITEADVSGLVSDLAAKAALISPSFTTPTLGVATATTVNKVTITAPATSATITVANGKTLTASNTLTFTGTDGSSVALGAGGTVSYADVPATHTYASTITLDLANANSETVSLTGVITFATTNRTSGTSKVLRIICDATSRALTFESGWQWLGSPPPTTITAGKTAILSIYCWGTATTDILASYSSTL